MFAMRTLLILHIWVYFVIRIGDSGWTSKVCSIQGSKLSLHLTTVEASGGGRQVSHDAIGQYVPSGGGRSFW